MSTSTGQQRSETGEVPMMSSPALPRSEEMPEFSPPIHDSDATVLRHHVQTPSESTGKFLFGNLPLFAADSTMNHMLGEKIHELLRKRRLHDAEATEALEQLTILNDALGKVLADTELLMWNGAQIRGTDLLAALLPPQSPGRVGAFIDSSVAGLSESIGVTDAKFHVDTPGWL